ncbi:hypothetical protein [Pontibacter burrus]|uniref:DUF3575 domain-containing protein n=1 Tax=Pontibacter burrus TaxID=2704466 RepID=A0A6B3LWJ4_9BACT|nr:hypothetical protein [Pontibacter burrus]NEM98248.1 hypothetical protein [Pontibacter burrus]
MRIYLTCTLIVLLAFYLPAPTQAQEFTQNIRAPFSVYLEIGGNSDAYTLNLDRIMYQREEWKGGLRAGVGTNLFFMKEEPGVYPVVPVEVYAMYGKSKSNLEVGLGYTRRFTDAPELLQNMFFARLGLRYQVPKGGLLVRFGLTPFISPEGKDRKTGETGIVPRFGLSVGYSL